MYKVLYYRSVIVKCTMGVCCKTCRSKLPSWRPRVHAQIFTEQFYSSAAQVSQAWGSWPGPAMGILLLCRHTLRGTVLNSQPMGQGRGYSNIKPCLHILDFSKGWRGLWACLSNSGLFRMPTRHCCYLKSLQYLMLQACSQHLPPKHLKC